jgi:flagellar P-ring protein precursor FlgI
MLRGLNLLTVLVLVALAPPTQAAVRIKDVTDLEGARPNQLYGLGVVYGLEGTGSRSLFTQQVVVDMLQKFGISAKIQQLVPGENVIRTSSAAVVMVTAEIGPFARKGSRLDCTVSILDDSSSLQGGTLVLTPLKGVDGQVYASAQGPISIGGFNVRGTAASVQRNYVSVGRIPGGALVEHEARGEVLDKGHVRFLLKAPDFNTARMIARAINDKTPGRALALDAGTVQVEVPHDRWPYVVSFVSDIGELEIVPDIPARVVINERTGTVVVGENVKISTVAISQGSLTVTTVERPQVSQPEPFSGGQTVVVPRTEISVAEERGSLRTINRQATVAELARALNALGVTPRDLISIFQAIKQEGGLHAELIIM